MKQPKVKIILDSGAYSAWKLGKPVNLDAYCEYLLANQDWIHAYVALDVIMPGSPEEAAKAGFENLLYMRKRGLDPIPVFHVGEDISWLYRMLDLRCSYIGLSASSLVSRNRVDDWYSLAWSHLVNKQGLPIVKTHAFGEGRIDSLKRFPWHSADTNSWLYSSQVAATVDIPEGKLSIRNDKRSFGSAADIDTLDRVERAIFERALKEARVKPEAFLERAVVSMTMRSYVTCLGYLRGQSEIRARHPIVFKPQGFLSSVMAAKTTPCVDVDFGLYLVCGVNTSSFPLAARLNHKHVLASYFYIKQMDATAPKEMQNKLKAFAYDPIGSMQKVVAWNRYWNILQEHIHAENS